MDTFKLIIDTIQSIGTLVIAGYIVILTRSQLSSKDATIEHLREQVRGLERQRSPQLAQEVERLTSFTDQVHSRATQLERENIELKEKLRGLGINPSKLRWEGFFFGFSTALRSLKKGVEVLDRETAKIPTITPPLALSMVRRVIEELADGFDQVGKKVIEDPGLGATPTAPAKEA